jgi:MFS transporter, SP family, general alpha glucoside:H+ symporter
MSANPQPEDKSVTTTNDVEEHGNSNGNVDTKIIDKALAAGEVVQMRSELDNLPVHKAFVVFRRVASLCMLAAFASALEGYRKSTCAADDGLRKPQY